MVIKYGFEGREKKYDEPSCCPICNESNEYSDTYYMEHVMMETRTKCSKCGHTNYWAHGFFVEPYEERKCPNCQSTDVYDSDGYLFTCNKCGQTFNEDEKVESK